MNRITDQYLSLVGVGLICLASGCASMQTVSPLARFEKSIVYQPSKFPPALDQKKIPFEDAQFEARDGTQLHGWFIDHDNPSAIALFCHGNAGNVASRGDTLLMLNQRHGLAVMTFDYRGYGKSQGKPGERGLLEDARAARRWLAKRKNIAEDQILIMGRSLGGAVAVDLAASDGAPGLVLASTFTSLPDVAKSQLPWLPMRWMMTQRFDSLSKIQNYEGPLLQSHGEQDRLIPYRLGQKLFRAAPGRKRFVTIPDAGHNDPQSEEYRLAFDQFVRDLGLNGPPQ